MSITVCAEEPNSSALQTEHSDSCPVDFYTIPVIKDAKFCQQFAATPPASLSYYTQKQQTAAKLFYLETFGPADKEQELKGRIVLQYNQGSKIVIISTDGTGSQVDILVKS
jgi:hypothetical protein